jgi:hypothetical protein
VHHKISDFETCISTNIISPFQGFIRINFFLYGLNPSLLYFALSGLYIVEDVNLLKLIYLLVVNFGQIYVSKHCLPFDKLRVTMFKGEMESPPRQAEAFVSS